MPISKIFEHRLGSAHKRVLNVMREDKFLPLREIARAIAKKYPDSEEVVKWKGRVGDISRYQVARYLKTLEGEGYVECNNGSPRKWRRLRQDSLLNEIVQGYVFEGRTKNRIEALKKLAECYIEDHKTEFQQYVSAVRMAKKIDEVKTREFESALQQARSVLAKLEPNKV